MGGIRGYGWGVVGRAGVCVRSGGVGGLEAQRGSEEWGRRGGDAEGAGEGGVDECVTLVASDVWKEDVVRLCEMILSEGVEDKKEGGEGLRW